MQGGNMNKGKFRKILASSTMGIMALFMPFILTGCDKDSDIKVRVEGSIFNGKLKEKILGQTYLQWKKLKI